MRLAPNQIWSDQNTRTAKLERQLAACSRPLPETVDANGHFSRGNSSTILALKRNYQKEVVEVACQLRKVGVIVQIIADVEDSSNQSILPILKFESQTASSLKKPWVLLTAGTHGDEPAGVLAVLQFVQWRLYRFQPHFNFLIYPCINPTGFSRGTRNNALNQNINRLFCAETDSIEAKAILEHLHLEERCYCMAIDCHEDSPEVPPDFSDWTQQAYAFYTYETAKKDENRVAPQVISALRHNQIDICSSPILYNDRNEGGIIRYGPQHGNCATNGIKDLDTYIAPYTGVVLTMETPTGWRLNQRIKTHLLAIEAALNYKLSVLKHVAFG